MGVAEGKIEKNLRLAIKAAGGLCIKLPAMLYRGIPDRMVLLPGGRIFFIELKARGGKKASVHQHRFKDILCSLGFTSVIITGETQLQEFLKTHVGDRRL